MYQTYRTNTENPYASGYVREMRWVPGNTSDSEDETEIEPETPDETQGLVNNPTYIDDDDEWEDTAEHLDSDIRDIIITGTVRLAFNPWSLPMRALRPCQPGVWSPTLGFPPLAMTCPFPGPSLSGLYEE